MVGNSSRKSRSAGTANRSLHKERAAAVGRNPRGSGKQSFPLKEDVLEPGPPGGGIAGFREFWLPFVISVVVHSLLLLILACWILPAEIQEEILAILSPQTEVIEDAEDAVENLEQPEQLNLAALDTETTDEISQQFAEVPQELTLDINDLEPSLDVDLPTFESPRVTLPRGEFSGRTTEGRKQRAIAAGGSEASERSVVLGLQWLKKIQRKDGSWNFNDVGAGTDRAGTLDNPMGATAMALLVYLGAGQTNHSRTPYQKTVGAGLQYLLRNAKRTADGLDLRGQTRRNEGMYVQGLCALALTEAYGMAFAAYKKNQRGRDVTGMRRAEFQTTKMLKNPAQASLNFIVRSQHLEGGGWRYNPGQPGDTSVVGWQIMALQSGRTAGLKVPDPTFRRAGQFLDSVEVDGGSQYGYDSPARNRSATTAVGLLCRMYMGWKRSNPALVRGVEFLGRTGPARNNMYYNYYAVQVMHHWGGTEWTTWNRVMRDQLIATQVQEGPAAGSWNPSGAHSDLGGRLVESCFSIMSLEVYYRHLPLYKKVSREAEQF